LRVQVLAASTVAAAATEALGAAAGPGARFELLRFPNDLELPEGQVELRARPVHVAPRSQVWLDLVVDGVVARSIVLPFRVSIERTVLVAGEDARAGQALESAASVAVRDVAGESGAVLDASALQSGRRLARSARPGELLTHAHLAERDEVVSGDRVSVVTGNGYARLETSGTVVRGGRLGQRVRVSLVGNDNQLEGNLVPNRTVIIE
jgi:flagella basal body P-ring formation protein FlgA